MVAENVAAAGASTVWLSGCCEMTGTDVQSTMSLVTAPVTVPVPLETVHVVPLVTTVTLYAEPYGVPCAKAKGPSTKNFWLLPLLLRVTPRRPLITPPTAYTFVVQPIDTVVTFAVAVPVLSPAVQVCPAGCVSTVTL